MCTILKGSLPTWIIPGHITIAQKDVPLEMSLLEWMCPFPPYKACANYTHLLHQAVRLQITSIVHRKLSLWKYTSNIWEPIKRTRISIEGASNHRIIVAFFKPVQCISMRKIYSSEFESNFHPLWKFSNTIILFYILCQTVHGVDVFELLNDPQNTVKLLTIIRSLKVSTCNTV